jgi:cell division protein FtsN
MAKQSKKQSGGTLTGIIIGLVIGLLIAVGVAMTIKNTPLPFINKLGKHEKLSERPAGQESDPNKPMYGNRNPSKEAAKDFVKKAEEKAAENPPGTQPEDGNKDVAKKDDVPKTDPKPAAKIAKTDDKPPVVDKSTSDKPAADKSQKADNTDEKFTYFLQAGAFLEQADAENTKAKLALMGLSANIGERQSDNGTLYRVRIGPFGQLEAMNRVRSKLTGNGVDVAVIRVPK